MTFSSAFKSWWSISRSLLGRRHCRCHSTRDWKRLNDCVKRSLGENKRERILYWYEQGEANLALKAKMVRRKNMWFWQPNHCDNVLFLRGTKSPKIENDKIFFCFTNWKKSIQVDPRLRITSSRPILSGWPHCHPNKIRETCHRVHEVGTRRVKHSFIALHFSVFMVLPCRHVRWYQSFPVNLRSCFELSWTISLLSKRGV